MGSYGIRIEFRNLIHHLPAKYSIFFASPFPGYLGNRQEVERNKFNMTIISSRRMKREQKQQKGKRKKGQSLDGWDFREWWGRRKEMFEGASALHTKVTDNDGDKDNSLKICFSIYQECVVWSFWSLKVYQDINNLLNEYQVP